MRQTWNYSWRVFVVAAGYILASMGAGWLIRGTADWASVWNTLLPGLLTGATLGPIAARVRGSSLRHLTIWGSVLVLNTLSLGIEGAFYAPVGNPIRAMPLAWTAGLLFESLVTAGLITWLFAPDPRSAGPTEPRVRAWYSWIWRFALSSFSYLLFYFIFGAINYALVTKPYYAAHVSGLAVPAPQTVLMAELVRAPLIVLSIVPLILAWRAKKAPLAAMCGLILFVVGGVVPLLLNTALPDFLRFASAIEIFFQNFLTGVVAAALLGFAPTRAPATG